MECRILINEVVDVCSVQVSDKSIGSEWNYENVIKLFVVPLFCILDMELPVSAAYEDMDCSADSLICVVETPKGFSAFSIENCVLEVC